MKIQIIGSGNVATHLCHAFADAAEVEMINSRTLQGIDLSADISLIAVSDEAIASVASRLPALEGTVAHTSGSVSIDMLGCRFKKKGVFYPLQTFSKNRKLDYSEIPVFIEGSDSEVEKELEKAANLFTGHIHKADSKLRASLHLSAVFACNFTNRLYAHAAKIMDSAGLDFQCLLPLIRESMEKLSVLTPEEAQTGPASRGDMEICRKHLQMLEADEEARTIYELLTQSIIKARNSNEDTSARDEDGN